MSASTISKDEKLTGAQTQGQQENSRNASHIDDCVKPHVAETSRLEDADDACFDSIG